MGSFLRVNGVTINGNFIDVLAVVLDVQDAIDKARKTGKTVFYTFRHQKKLDWDPKVIGGFLIGPDAQVDFQLVEPSKEEIPEVREKFMEHWEDTSISRFLNRSYDDKNGKSSAE